MASPVFESFKDDKPAHFDFCIQPEVYFNIAYDYSNSINLLGFSPVQFPINFLVNFEATQKSKSNALCWWRMKGSSLVFLLK